MSDPAQTELLQRIAATARDGRLDEAALLVEQARISGQMNPTLAALGGAIEFHRGQFARALPLLIEAQSHHPADMTIRANLAVAHFQCGDNAAALALCDPKTIALDPSLRLARLGGHLAQEAEDYTRAIAAYRIVTKTQKDDWAIWNNLGNALSANGDVQESANALEQAVRLAPNSAPIRVNLGTALAQAGRIADAERVLKEAAAVFLDDHHPFLALYTLYNELGREDESYSAIKEAALRAPDNAALQSDFGQEAARRNDYAIAEVAFEAALVLEPSLGPPFVGLAAVYERMNRDAELDPLYDRAVSHGVDAESLAFIEALRHKRSNDIDAAFAALERAGDVVVAGRKHHLRGTMLDRLGRHDEAFDAFTAMNAHWIADPSGPLARAAHYRDMAAQAMAMLTPEWVQSWSPDTQASPRPTPIFLLGFPRSGTTLLDTMLMADPSVRVLEEEPFIGQIEDSLGGMSAMASLTPQQIALARADYFAKVEALVGPLKGVQIVDKHPMHLNKVAVIRRLFPQAKFVLALRHPCDVVLSCFLTNFRINNAMANFLTLEDAAALYDLSFTHWERAKKLFDLPVGTVMYERLVADKDRELQPLFDWLGLKWPGEAFDHRDAARARGTVATASYAQVTEPIYTRASGRWTRYRTQLEPVMSTLDSWIKRHGYDA